MEPLSSREDRPRDLPRVAPYLILGGLWLAFAFGIAPAIVAAAYGGRSLAIFNRVFAGRAPRPLSVYLGMWRGFAVAVPIAGGLHLAARAWARRHLGGATLGIFAAAFLLVTLASGPRHDYVADLEIWDAVRAGNDPWFLVKDRSYPLNAYGPLFNALAPLAWISPFAPKLLFAASYIGLVGWLLCRCPTGSSGWARALLIYNPWPWVEIALFGHFDILMAVACVAAVELRREGRDVGSGMALAAGVLLKYFPAVILPFLLLNGRRGRLRLGLSFGLTVGLGLGASLLVWGDTTFRPIAFATGRGSSLLSVFRFLRGGYSPLALVMDAPNVDRLSLPCMAIAGLSVFAWYATRRPGVVPGSFLAVATTLLFYQVGFPQYQMVSLALAASWFALEPRRWRDDRWLAAAVFGFFGYLGAFDLVFAAKGGCLSPDPVMVCLDELGGLPTFVLGSAAVVASIRSLHRERSVA